MATLTIPYTDGTWGGNYGQPSSAYIRLTYTASNGTVTITEIEGQINWSYGTSDSWDYDPPTTYIKVGGTSKKITINQIYFKDGGWTAWGLTDISWTGLTGKENISFSMTLSEDTGSSHEGAEFEASIPMSLTSYTITYNANGGSLGDVPSKQTKKYGINATITTKKPTRSNYTFQGWGTSSSATTVSYSAGSTYKSNASITLYAIWKANNNETTIRAESSANFLEHLHVAFYQKVSSNTHTIKFTSGSNSVTTHTKSSLSTASMFDLDFAMSSERFGTWFPADQDEIDVTITVTTYNSSGTSLGSVSDTFVLKMREKDGRPSKPSASVSRSANGATITLTPPSTFKYGASFKGWYYTYNYGTISLSGNTITASKSATGNQTYRITIWAVDTRGFISDKIDVVWFARKKGPCVYQNGSWRAAKPYLYTSSGWAKRQAYVHDGSAWKKSKR